VVGVLAEGGAFDRGFAQLWRPLVFEESQMTRDFHWLVAFARLAPGVTLEQAQAHMDTIGARLEHEFPESNKAWGVIVEPYADTLLGGEQRTSILVLMAATVMVLLIGCANLANLALARGVAREREVAVRAAVGADRRRHVRQVHTENEQLIQESLASGAREWVDWSRGLDGERQLNDGVTGTGTNELLMRNQHRAWVDYMTGQA